MQFLYPGFLWALSLLALPIIIHLFHFRRFKKVYFTNVAFLKEVKEEVSARSRLKNLLVLLMRLLALAFLVFAFAQPVKKQDTTLASGIAHVGFIIDNSFSMTNANSDITLLDRAKQRANEIIEASPEQQKFTLLTNDQEAKHQYLLTKEEISAYIEKVSASPKPFDWQIMHSKMSRFLQSTDSENLSSFVFSDFGVEKSAVESTVLDSTIQWYMIPFRAVQEKNVSIDSAWIASPVQAKGENVEILANVKNYSDQEIDNIRLNVNYNGQNKPVSTFSLAAGEMKTESVKFNSAETGWYDVLLKLTDYPIQFDDSYHLSFEVPENIKVLVLYDRQVNRYLKAALESSNILESSYESSKNISYNSFPDHSLIIIQELQQLSSGLMSELRDFVKEGGHVLFVPAEKANITQYNEFLSKFNGVKLGSYEQVEKEVYRINREEVIFQNVFLNDNNRLTLPKTKGSFSLPQNARSQRKVLSFRDGNPFLSRVAYEQGNLFLLYAPLDLSQNDLVGNAEIFVPMIYRMAISAGVEKATSFTIGSTATYDLRNSTQEQDPIYRLKNIDSEIIPRTLSIQGKTRLVVEDEIKTDGFYELTQAGQKQASLAFNYDRKESVLDRLDEEMIKTLLPQAEVVTDEIYTADFGRMIAERTSGKALWKWCIIFVLLFLVLESLLLRIWKA